MFQVNDYVMYGTKGVCQITDIGKIDFGKKNADYYFLKAVGDKSGTIYVEVGSDKVRMRGVVSKNEAEQIIDRMPKSKGIWIEDEKSREATYRQVIESCDCDKLVDLLKGLYDRREARMLDGKKLTDIDGRTFAKAEHLLHGELAVALGMQEEQLENYIRAKNGIPA